LAEALGADRTRKRAGEQQGQSGFKKLHDSSRKTGILILANPKSLNKGTWDVLGVAEAAEARENKL
jgi:hypothetical protein